MTNYRQNRSVTEPRRSQPARLDGLAAATKAPSRVCAPVQPQDRMLANTHAFLAPAGPAVMLKQIFLPGSDAAEKLGSTRLRPATDQPTLTGQVIC